MRNDFRIKSRKLLGETLGEPRKSLGKAKKMLRKIVSHIIKM